PDRMSPSIAATSFRNLDEETRNKLQSMPNNDEVLAQAIRRSRVVVGQVGSATPVPRSQAESTLKTGFAVRGPDPGPFLVTFPGLEASTDQNGRFWVHFNRHDPARYVSAKDVLQGRVLRDRIEGKLVLIGTSAVGLLDVKTTPVAAAMPGVEVHAQVVESVLT